MKICNNTVNQATVKHIPGNVYKGNSSANSEVYIASYKMGELGMVSLTTGRVDISPISCFTDVTEQYCLQKVK